jgi:hypothetical protein
MIAPATIANGAMRKETGSIITALRIGEASLVAWKYTGR